MNAAQRPENKIKIMATVFALTLLLPTVAFLCSARATKASLTWNVSQYGTGISSIQQAIDAANDGDTVFVFSGTYYEHLIVDKSLTIIGESQHDTIIDGSQDGTVITVTANNVTIKGFTIQHGGIGVRIATGTTQNTLLQNSVLSNSYYGIYGELCGQTTIAENNASFNSWYGIFLYGSGPCVMNNNLVTSNELDGVFIRASSNSTLTGNLVSNNQLRGIRIYSDDDPLRAHGLPKNNAIRNNHVLNNSCGIEIAYSGTDTSPANNEVCENFLGYNNLGMNISGTNGNFVYHNNFINNSRQASTNDSSNNSWDDSYYDGGNYWSDYNCTDLFWGPDQNEIGSDGITDVPYMLSANPGEEDKYPFTHADGWLSSQEVNILSPSNKTYRSRTLPLLVTTNKPARLSYSLDGQANLTITENLILSDLPSGTHNVMVHASDNFDSTASSETAFTITFLGDINLDETVDILDIFVVAQSFDSTPENERWNPNADLNNDAVIDILDIFLVAKEYGNTL